MPERKVLSTTDSSLKRTSTNNATTQFSSYIGVNSPQESRNLTNHEHMKPSSSKLSALPIKNKQVSINTNDRPSKLSFLREFYANFGREATSKVNDGLIPPVVLILLTLLFNLIVIPIEFVLKLPGMLVFVLLLISFGAIALDRSIQARYSHSERAFQGMLAGLFFWFAADTIGLLGETNFNSQSSILFMLLVALVVTAMWRSIFPSGVKFFAIVFLLNWIGRFLFSGQIELIQGSNAIFNAQNVYGVIAVVCVVLFVFVLFLRTKSRSQRLWFAIGIWFFGLQSLTLLLNWTL
jgi:hypothetical protein